VPEEAVKNTLIAKYNDLDSVKQHFEKHDDIAGVIIEPIAGNMGVVLPKDNFLVQLKEYVHSKGALLIVDEVMTGFRSKFGGAQELLGVQADITCLGKVVGGGFPVGAYGARNEIMEMVAPLGGMYQAGTLSGNPIAMAAGIATLTELKKQDPYQKLGELSSILEVLLLESAKKYGVDLVVNKFGSMINPFFTNKPINNFEDAQACNTEQFAVFFWELIKEGVFIPPSQFESWFLSSALSEKDIEKTAKAIDKAMERVAIGN
jgi:glutamate-1-semialdehyde 2,1-aminomutase